VRSRHGVSGYFHLCLAAGPVSAPGLVGVDATQAAALRRWQYDGARRDVVRLDGFEPRAQI